MEATLELIREQQKQSWNTFSPGWRKWDDFTMTFLRPMGTAIIRELQLKEEDQVLDVATGTGEPGLSIAKIVSKGSVTGVDISEGMLEIANEHAKAQGVKNYTTLSCDISELPFEDGHFDAISCRMGFMFFPDMKMAAAEMQRVLRSGGRMATSVWGSPEKNPWVTAMMGNMKKHIEMPAPPPGSPGMFRCADSNEMKSVLSAAGFRNIKVEEISGKVDYETADRYWQSMNELAAPVVAAMTKADEATKALIRKDVMETLAKICPDGSIQLDYSAFIYSAEKP